MDILFFSDDPDDGAIFMDTIFEINPDINCTIIASDENALSTVNESESPQIFLDYNNLPEKFAMDFIKLLHNHKQSRKTKVIIYSSENLLTNVSKKALTTLGVSGFVIKTSHLPTLRNSISDSLK
jgi:response regulator of citrate/malate metabolism